MAAIVGSIISLGSICLFYDQTLSNYRRVDWDTKYKLDTLFQQFFLQNMNYANSKYCFSIRIYHNKTVYSDAAATLVGHL